MSVLPLPFRRLLRRSLCVAPVALALLGCPPPKTPERARAESWFRNALDAYRNVNMGVAYDDARQALFLVPDDPQVRTLAARVALARLDYDEAVRDLEGLHGSEVSALRGRAYWYKGDVERAADEMGQLMADPDAADSWAKQLGKLAHSAAGRKPFEMSCTQGNLAMVEMSRVAPGGHPLYVVPVEIDGDPALTLIATGTPEVVIDSGASKDPGWVSMRFGRQLEVRDVPALAQDLSELSQRLGAPIKALLGTNLLRHLNVTLDYRGRQFVARMFAPPRPEVASRVDVFYPRGGGMVVGVSLGDYNNSPPQGSPLLIDTAMDIPVALDPSGWKKIGIATSSLQALTMWSGAGRARELRVGAIPWMKLGALGMFQVPAALGPSFERQKKDLEVNLDGAVGAGLLASYRLTLAEGGRVLWIENPP